MKTMQLSDMARDWRGERPQKHIRDRIQTAQQYAHEVFGVPRRDEVIIRIHQALGFSFWEHRTDIDIATSIGCIFMALNGAMRNKEDMRYPNESR